MSLISRFISEQGKILSRRVNRLTLKQQRLITVAIKQARILSLLPFLNNEKQFERTESTPRTTGPRTRNKQNKKSINLSWVSDWNFDSIAIEEFLKLENENSIVAS